MILYGSNALLVKERGNKVLKRIKDQNIKENFTQAKIRFSATKDLYNKLIREAAQRAAQHAHNKKEAKYLRLKKTVDRLALVEYWEKSWDVDKINQEKLLGLIKKQHQEAMIQLKRLMESIKKLKIQVKQIEQQKEKILNYHSKATTKNLKRFRFKDGTSPFSKATDQQIESLLKDYFKEEHDDRRELEKIDKHLLIIQQKLSNLRQKKRSERARKETKKKHSFPKEKSNNDLWLLEAPPTLIQFKRHKENLQNDIRNLLSPEIKSEEQLSVTMITRKMDYIKTHKHRIQRLAEKNGLEDLANSSESNRKDLAEHLEAKTIEIHNQLNSIDDALQKIHEQEMRFEKEYKEVFELEKERAKEMGSTSNKEDLSELDLNFDTYESFLSKINNNENQIEEKTGFTIRRG